MKMVGNTVIKWLVLILSCSTFFSIVLSAADTQTYIIRMDKSAKPESFSDHLDWYSSKVSSVLTKPDQDRIIYTYQTAFHGVAAQLTKQEAQLLEQQDGVLAMFPETKYELHTTRSPLFLGLEPHDSMTSSSSSNDNVWSKRVTDHDVIVGVLDTGVWPESQSFNDTGMSAVPRMWRGACEVGRGFTKRNCNRKVVGARIFYKGYEAATGKMNEQAEYKSPRDQDGHGTHTAATVAGSPVKGANLLGYASGTARGMAPAARIAVYKVCWVGGCFSSDIMAAVDRAVADGVDVLSISLGGGVISSYYGDSLSIAAFGAMEKGVFVSSSAGNGGPDPVSLTNLSPWITTVGASTMDRDFPATVKLGNGRTVTGVSLYSGRMKLDKKKLYPVVYAGGNSTSPDASSLCLEGALNPRKVKGKIVICDRGISPRVQKGEVVKNAGGVGMILANTAANGEELVGDSHLIPAVAVGENEAKMIKHYALTSLNAKATLVFLGTRVGVRPSPIVAAFSSRGPNVLTLEVLKPDLVAPGVNILAAWTGALGPSSLATDRRRVKFNILSGTSMSCPHVSGIAALLKSRHPEWSPAAIKSALMTTAYVHDNLHKPLGDAESKDLESTPFDHGAGHINPRKALDPGLIYDIQPQDYLEFLCTQSLTPMQLKVFSNRTCRHTMTYAGDLNYPAISVVFTYASVFEVHRTVTNVGPAVSSYHAVVSPFQGAYVKVEPRILNFTKVNQKLSYKVTFTANLGTNLLAPEFGGLVWKDGAHRVRSPIVLLSMDD